MEEPLLPLEGPHVEDTRDQSSVEELGQSDIPSSIPDVAFMPSGANHGNDDGPNTSRNGNDDGMNTTTSSSVSITTNIPAHQARVLQGIFGLLGVGILVPWNAFINAKPYFASRFCVAEGDPVNSHLESNFALVYNLSAITWLGGILLCQYMNDQRAAAREPHDITLSQRVETASERSKQAHTHSLWLVLVPLAIYVAVFLGQSIGVSITHISPHIFERLTLLSMGLCGACGATATAGILAMAGLFPSSIGVGPFMAGQSFGGVAVSLANFVAATWEDPESFRQIHCNETDVNTTMTTTAITTTNTAADTCMPYTHFDAAVFGYFFAGAIVLFASLCGYIYIDHYQKRRHRNEYEAVGEAQNSAAVNLAAADESLLTVDQSPRVGLEMTTDANLGDDDRPTDPTTGSLDGFHGAAFHKNEVPESFLSETMEENQGDSLVFHNDDQSSSHNETAQVWQKVRQPALCIYLVFTVTLALFPGWISQLQSTQQCKSRSRWDNDLYTPMAFVLFNTFDLVGRILASYVPVTRIRNVSRKLASGAFLRFLCFPLLSMCVGGTSSRVEIPSNLYSLIAQILFATSNGFLVTLAFIYAPSVLPPTTHVQERSAELLNFSLSLGLLSGSFLSFAVAMVLH